jgi:hypothetical protein
MSLSAMLRPSMAVTATAYTPNGIPVPLGGPFADGLVATSKNRAGRSPISCYCC